MHYEIEVNGRLRQVVVHRTSDRLVVSVDGREWSVDAVPVDGHTLSLLLDSGHAGSPANPAAQPARALAYAPAPGPRGVGGSSYEVSLLPNLPGAGHGELSVRVRQAPMAVAFNGRRRLGRKEESPQGAGPQRLTAPMPGKIVRVLVAAGDSVRARQPIVVVEAMKMENELRAQRDGRVAEVLVKDGQPVEAGTVLAVITDS